MRTLTRLTAAVSLLLAVACTGAGPTGDTTPTATSTPTGTAGATASADLKTPPPGWTHNLPTHEVDPVAVAMSAEGLKGLCDLHLGRARTLLAEIKAQKGKKPAELTWDDTLAKVDRIGLEVSIAAGFSELMSMSHPDEPIREAGKGCRPKATELETDMMLDADFAAVVRAYAEKKEALTGTRKRLLDETLRELRRNGLELDAAGQKRLRTLNDDLAKLAQEFETNLSDTTLFIEVKPAQLKGLPEEYIKQHPPQANGLVKLTTDYPDYFPILEFCEDRTVARDLNKLFDSRAADKNMSLLSKVLDLRLEKAKLLGYKSWAEYAIEPRMAKTPAAVKDFLERAAAVVKEPAKKELAEFRAEWEKLGGKKGEPIPNYDRLYLETRLRKKKYAFDAQEISKYFEVRAVTTGMLSIFEKMYGVRFEEEKGAKRWHEDVRVLDVKDNGGGYIGRIYLDLHPRAGKFKHAAMFEIRPGVMGPKGYVTPISALVCNFPKPGDAPALMSHSDVTTFFHEFGHALHHVLTRQELVSYSGTNTATDFVEAPSQMLEEWTFQRETLDLFAKHHQTGEKIPDALFKAMQKSRAFGRPLATERQISLATLDFEYHARAEKLDTDKVFDEVMKKTQSFVYQPGTHFQATFGHLMGYDAGYYGYQWALSLARDVLTRFEKEGWLNTKTAADWRRMVLEQGAGPDERELVKKFLGREPNLDAYGRFLAGK
ncbi:MAG: Zn-dependent oligopeptidase [Polyangiaceae bacterium]|nr:Zn-dependent oligopeptidase [Polyangiaceae bacterium]